MLLNSPCYKFLTQKTPTTRNSLLDNDLNFSRGESSLKDVKMTVIPVPLRQIGYSRARSLQTSSGVMHTVALHSLTVHLAPTDYKEGNGISRQLKIFC